MKIKIKNMQKKLILEKYTADSYVKDKRLVVNL